MLIIEDNNDIRENTAEILELAGYTVSTASNGRAGVDLAIKNPPDIILCDIMMPELDGYGVFFMLSKTPELATIPFIFLTAKAERGDLRKGMEMGADDYLTKPFDDMDLLKALESRLKKKELQEKYYSRTLDNLSSIISKNNGLDELRKAINERRTRIYKKDQAIYYEGDSANGLYVLLSGKIKAVKLAEDGRELMTGLYGTDNYLGVHAMLSGEPYSDTATALEESTLCLLPKEQLNELMNLYPDVAREFIKLLANDIREKEGQLLQLAYNSVRKRMADAIVKLYKNQRAGADGFRMSREDLAAMAGMASETVSRTLSDFKDEGLIEKKGGSICVLQPAKLEKMRN